MLLFLGNWWNTLTGIEQIFWGIAIVFSVLFVIQFVLSLIGFDFDTDTDIDISTDTDVGHDFDADFTVFSVRSIIAFFTFFGWAGVLALNAGATGLIALAFASASGLGAMFLVGYLMYKFSQLGISGNVDVNDALYNVGEVYFTIPPHKKGRGKVHISINGSLRELDAITNGESLTTGAKIKVVEVLSDELILVEPAVDLKLL